MKLNLGCGSDYRMGWLNTDVGNVEKDLEVDMNREFPFEDNIFDLTYSSHVLEHLQDVEFSVNEMIRITKKDGKIVLLLPHYSSFTVYTDLSHKRSGFSYFTFGEDWVNHNINSKVKVLKRKLIFTRCHFKFLNYIFNPIINLFPTLYERFFSFILPCSSVLFVMERK